MNKKKKAGEKNSWQKKMAKLTTTVYSGNIRVEASVSTEVYHWKTRTELSLCQQRILQKNGKFAVKINIETIEKKTVLSLTHAVAFILFFLFQSHCPFRTICLSECDQIFETHYAQRDERTATELSQCVCVFLFALLRDC